MGLRTDLAFEAHEALEQEALQGVEGIKLEQRTYPEGLRRTALWISNEKGARVIGRPVGQYITFESKKLRENDRPTTEKVLELITQELNRLAPDAARQSILVVGLGNRMVTADSLGPLSAEKILTTRHIHQGLPSDYKRRMGMVSCIAPGVMGQTGLATEEVIASLVAAVHPDLVVAIDALAAGHIERLNATIQLTDTGVCPGSGMGLRSQELSRRTLGVPVLAIGVPTVVDANCFSEELGKETLSGFYVTTKDMDAVALRLSHLIAGAINRFAHRLTKEEWEAYQP